MDSIRIDIHINRTMNSLLERDSLLNLGLLDDGLSKLLKSRLIKNYEDCVILKSHMISHKAQPSDFIDKTGYECFINKLNLENYLSNPDKGASFYIQQASLTLLEIMKLITELKESKSSSYAFILSINQYDTDISLHSYVLRFHKLRTGEIWLEADLDSYQEALMVLTFTKSNADKNVDMNDLKNLFMSEIQRKIGK